MFKINHFCRYIMKHPKRTSLFAGFLSSLAFAPVFVFPILFVTIPLLMVFVYKSSSYRDAFMYGWIFGFGHFFSGLYWITIAVTVYMDDFWWMLPFALFEIPIVMAFAIAFVALFARMFRSNSWVFILAFTVFWAFVEWVRSWLMTGFPWNLMGYSLCFSDILIQSANLGGVYLLSLLVMYISGNLFFYILGKKSEWRRHLAISLLLVVIAIIYGSLRLYNNPTFYEKHVVRIIQPSLPQEDKWDVQLYLRNLNKYLELSTRPSEQKIDMMLWPEESVTAFSKSAKLIEYISDAIPDNGVLITGATIEEQKGDDSSLYSSIYGLNSNREVEFEYHKSRLVPFGEYIPFRSWIPLELKSMTSGMIDYVPGKGGETIKIQNFPGFRPLICYEAIFPADTRIGAEQAELLINVTNDAWYGNSSGPYQHFHISRMRAVENAIPMLRAGNNGISAIIDPVGRVIKSLPINAVDVIDGQIPKTLECQTIYNKWGDVAILLWVSFLSLVHYCFRRSE